MSWLLSTGTSQYKLQIGLIYLIGRKTDADKNNERCILIDSELLDLKHAIIETAAAMVLLLDLQSTKGCYVDGARIASLEHVQLKTDTILSFGGVEAKLQLITDQLEQSSGFHDDSAKNSSDIINASPEKSIERSLRAQRGFFLLPNGIDDKSKNGSIDVSTNPLQNVSAFENSSLAETEKLVTSLNVNANEADADADFCIPETQVLPLYQRAAELSPVPEKLPTELWETQESSEGCTQIRISTQDYNETNENSCESSNTLMNSLVIPRIQHSPVIIDNKNDSNIQKQLAGGSNLTDGENVDIDFDADSDAEMRAMQWTKKTTENKTTNENARSEASTPDIFEVLENNAKDEERMNTCTPDLFDLPMLTKPTEESPQSSVSSNDKQLIIDEEPPTSEENEAKQNEQIEKTKVGENHTPELFAKPAVAPRTSNSTIVTCQADVHSSILGDDEDFIATQPYVPLKNKTSDTHVFQPPQDEFAPICVTLSDKENQLPNKKKAQQISKETTVALNTNVGDEQDFIPTQAFVPTKDLAKVTAPNQPNGDMEDFIATQIFVSNRAMNSTLVASDASKNVVSFFADIERTPKKQPSGEKHLPEKFKLPEGNAKRGPSSSSSSSSINSQQFTEILQTPQIIAKIGHDMKDQLKVMQATKRKSLFNENESVTKIFDVQNNSNSYDELLPHLRVLEQTPKNEPQKHAAFRQSFPNEMPKMKNVRVTLTRHPQHGDESAELVEKSKIPKKIHITADDEKEPKNINDNVPAKDDKASKQKKQEKQLKDKKKNNDDKKETKKSDTKEHAPRATTSKANKEENTKKPTKLDKKPDKDKMRENANKLETEIIKKKETNTKTATQMKNIEKQTKDLAERATPSKANKVEDLVEELPQRPVRKRRATYKDVAQPIVKRVLRSKHSDSETVDTEKSQKPQKSVKIIKKETEKKTDAERETLKRTLRSNDSESMKLNSDSSEPEKYESKIKKMTQRKTHIEEQKSKIKIDEQPSTSKNIKKRYEKPKDMPIEKRTLPSKNAQIGSASDSNSDVVLMRRQTRLARLLSSESSDSTSSTNITQSSNSKSVTTKTATQKTNQKPFNKMKIATTMVDGQQLQALMYHIKDHIVLVQDPTECDILIMDTGNRTYKFLVSIAKGTPICTTKWLKAVKEANGLVKPTEEHFFTDPKFEKNFHFTVKSSLIMARKQKILEDYHFLMTPNTLPKPKELQVIIKSAGGVVHTETPKLSENQTLFLISNDQDRQYWHKYRRLKSNLRIIATEAIMLCIMRQQNTLLSNDKFLLY